jgi:hypothetical protein
VALVGPTTKFTTPDGRFPTRQQSTITIAVPGVCDEGRTMTEQPAARAGATLRAINAAGKFHAVKAAATPTGSWLTSKRPPGTRLSTIRP